MGEHEITFCWRKQLINSAFKGGVNISTRAAPLVNSINTPYGTFLEEYFSAPFVTFCYCNNYEHEKYYTIHRVN